MKKSSQYVAGQEFLFYSEKWGKLYMFLKDIDGTIYMVPCDAEGVPQFDRLT